MRTRLSIGIALLLASAAAPLNAQTNGASADNDDATDRKAKEKPSDDTPVVDIDPTQLPQSVSVITVDRFETMGALNLQDSLRYAAGVRTETYGLDPRGDFGFIRGAEVPIYQDGLRRTFGFRAGARPELFTLSRIEVLRGPASMLYGQGSTGGLLNLVTKRPEYETRGEIFGAYGSFDRKEAGVDLTGPLVADRIAGRVIGFWRDSETQTDFANEKRWLVNASLRVQLAEDTELTLLAQAQDDENGWAGQPLPYAATLGRSGGAALARDANLGEPSTDRADFRSRWIAASFSHQFSYVVEFRQQLRYDWYRSDQYLHYADVFADPANPFLAPGDPALESNFPGFVAAPGRVLNRYQYGEVFRARAFTSDSQFQFDFESGPLTHKVVVGADFSRFSNRARVASGYSADMAGVGAGASPLDAFAPVYGNIIEAPYIEQPREVQTQLGLYLQGQTRFGDRALITFGVRRDRARTTVPGSDAVVQKDVTARGGLLVDLGSGFVPYLSYSQSFQPIPGVDNNGEAFRPQHGRQHEIGLKWQADRWTWLTLAAYDLRDENRLRTDPFNPFRYIQTGVVNTHGIEVEVSRTIPGNLDLIASYSYTRAKDAAEDGRQIESVPRHLASIWAMKYLPVVDSVSLILGAGMRYVDESIAGSTGDGTPISSPDYILADALIGADHGPWSFTVSASNLFDKRYYTTCLGRGDCYLGARRSVNATLGFHF